MVATLDLATRYLTYRFFIVFMLILELINLHLDSKTIILELVHASWLFLEFSDKMAAILDFAWLAMPAGLPPGLAYLQGLDEVKVGQILELAEVLVGWERNNKYNICNNQGQKFMYAREGRCSLVDSFSIHYTHSYLRIHICI